MSSPALKRTAPESCTHQPEYLGADRGTRFLSCKACGKVFVSQAGQLWSVPLRRDDPPGDAGPAEPR